MKRCGLLAILVFASGCTIGPPANTVNPNALEVKETEMVLLESTEGTALIDFTDFGGRNAVSTYRWRFQPSTAGASEVSGSGVVFEKFEKTKAGFGTKVLDRKRSRLAVTAGRFAVEWSYGSPSSGWLYLDKEKIRATVLSEADFETYDLKQAVEPVHPPEPADEPIVKGESTAAAELQSTMDEKDKER